jgi:tungstate transport system substrate-binding protein
MKNSLLLISFLSHFLSLTPARANDFILMQSTTSTQNSGLLDYLLPKYEALTGTEVRVVAVGTGQALKNAANGDADVVMVHAKQAEIAFIQSGFGVKRHPLMYNEFLIIGPINEFEVAHASRVSEVLGVIATKQKRWISRGDMSGTHKRELQLWDKAKINTSDTNWYLDIGGGMGAAINTAVELNAYTLTDSATWLSYKNRRTHKVVFSGDPALYNQYSLILVNPKKHRHVKTELAMHFINWMTNDDGQSLIDAYKLKGNQLFFSNASEK